MLSDQQIDGQITAAANKLKAGADDVLKQICELKNPDGLTTAASEQTKVVTQDLTELKKRYCADAKSAAKKFTGNQMRSKMLVTRKGRYLVELM